MPNQPKTPMRSFRVDDELWRAAHRAAAANGETLTEVLRRSLQAYISRRPQIAAHPHDSDSGLATDGDAGPNDQPPEESLST